MNIEELRETVYSKIVGTPIFDPPAPREVYEIVTTCDAGDVIEGNCTCTKEGFEDNLLLVLVLSMVNKNLGKLFPDEKYEGYYGHYIGDNKYFPWLDDYLIERDLLPFCYFSDNYAHSIDDVDIIYYDSRGVKYRVTLPDFDELFETKDDAIDTLNLLYGQWLVG